MKKKLQTRRKWGKKNGKFFFNAESPQRIMLINSLLSIKKKVVFSASTQRDATKRFGNTIALFHNLKKKNKSNRMIQCADDVLSYHCWIHTTVAKCGNHYIVMTINHWLNYHYWRVWKVFPWYTNKKMKYISKITSKFSFSI